MTQLAKALMHVHLARRCFEFVSATPCWDIELYLRRRDAAYVRAIMELSNG